MFLKSSTFLSLSNFKQSRFFFFLPSHNIWTLRAPMFLRNFSSILYLLIIHFYEKIAIGLLANLALVWICCSYHVGENSKIDQFPAHFLEKTEKNSYAIFTWQKLCFLLIHKSWKTEIRLFQLLNHEEGDWRCNL
jgi:hypothetical protein